VATTTASEPVLVSRATTRRLAAGPTTVKASTSKSTSTVLTERATPLEVLSLPTVANTVTAPRAGATSSTVTASSAGATSSTATTSSTIDPPIDPLPEITPEPVPAVEIASGRGAEGGPAIPAMINIALPSSNHPDGVTMTVMPHGPAGNGEMWIPGPEEGIDNWANAVSWLNTEGFAAPYSTHGAVIIAGHINWKGTAGALSDLSEYGADDVGRTLTVTMTDGRVRAYRITRGLTINKAELAAESNQGPLHTAMFGQIESYGSPDHPTEELRLISCGGEFDATAASYESNVIVFARPIG
jgi:hypothetical protein